MSEKIDYSKGVYDAKKLGTGRMFILGVQHMFAMFGATVLVPLLTGLSVSTTLLCAGLGTLLFHLITKKKVPAFLGSSFAYLGGFSIVAPMLADADGNLTVANTKMLPYACAAIAFSGLVYLVASLLISTFGIRRIMKFFPPVVTGPIIISIGLILAPSAITNCQSNWLLAFVALGTVIVCNIWGKGMVKILPILIGVLVSYAVALVTGAVDFQKISEAAWLGIPLHKDAMGLFAIDGSPEFISALFTIIPIALATMMEHVGDIAAISATVGHNYINDPGLNQHPNRNRKKRKKFVLRAAMMSGNSSLKKVKNTSFPEKSFGEKQLSGLNPYRWITAIQSSYSRPNKSNIVLIAV